MADPTFAPSLLGITTQKAIAVPSSVGASPTATFSGTFTVVQWPPNGGSSTQGNIAVLADTYGNTTFEWAFEYRPDLDLTYPWRSVGGLQASYSTATQVMFSTITWSSGATLQVPIAGKYGFDTYVFCGNANQGGSTPSASAGFSTSNSGAPPSFATATIPNVSTLISQGSDLGELATVALTKGQTIYFMENAAAQAAAHAVGSYRPIKIANS